MLKRYEPNVTSSVCIRLPKDVPQGQLETLKGTSFPWQSTPLSPGELAWLAQNEVKSCAAS